MKTLVLYCCSFFSCLFTAQAQTVSTPKVSQIAKGNITYNPYYYDDLKVLLFCDVTRRTVNAYNPVTKKLYTITTDESPSFILPISGTTDKYILAKGRDLVVLSWNFTAGTSYYTCLVVSVDSCCPGNIWSSGFAGGSGRVIGGTRGPLTPQGVVPGQGTLYVVDTTLPGKAAVTPMLTNQDSVRSLAFTVNNTVGFYTNRSISVYKFNYDVNTSIISNLTPIFNFTNYNLSCIPAGLAADIYGNVWVAGFGCGQVFKFNTTTLMIDQTINITQAQYLNNLIFGGINRTELYVTSSDRNSTGKTSGPGGVFRVQNIGAQGFRDNLVVMNSDCTPVYTPS